MANKITVTSAGTVANANVTPDSAMYYSNKSKEWAISNKIVDNTDYSSKYYAGESKKQADISTAKATEVIESGNTALSSIDTAKNNAITSITNQETTSKTSLIDEGATQIGLIQNEGATQVANVQSTGFYMRDDKLYYINSQGEETEFKLDDIELNNPYSLFDSKYSDHDLNNLSWLKSSGQWNAKAVYPTAYDKLLKVYNGTETVEGLSVKLSTETYTDYDFVLNTADETFRLPLKNHTADDGNSVLTLYYYIGETVQNANLIDAGRIGEQLATKASVNDIDGAFVKSVLVLVNGTTYTVGTTHDTKTLLQFDISNYLPEDSNEYDYEVRLSSEGYTITNNSVMLWIDTPSVADISQAWSDQQTTSCGSVGSVVTQIIPKGYKKASIYLRSGSSSMMFYSHIVGYRRLRKGA